MVVFGAAAVPVAAAVAGVVVEVDVVDGVVHAPQATGHVYETSTDASYRLLHSPTSFATILHTAGSGLLLQRPVEVVVLTVLVIEVVVAVTVVDVRVTVVSVALVLVIVVLVMLVAVLVLVIVVLVMLVAVNVTLVLVGVARVVVVVVVPVEQPASVGSNKRLK